LALGFPLRNGEPAKYFSSEMRDGGTHATAKVLTDIEFGNSSDFPSAVEMFEVLPGESGFGLIAKNQIGLGQRAVPAEVPGLADLKVAQQVRGYVRSERNCHQRIEKFFSLFEVGIDSRQVKKPERGEMSKQREVGFKMVHEFSEACLWPREVGKRHHREKKHR